ncbi:SCO family protein [Sinorhizobium meliloti]|uniref:SCO family protein n=1 Tax=Rhizobium meliloti TaxID=382 RepID=UPI000FD9553E|nr:SCO family protein [Sinorhizobium meliloti]RVQ50505.1 SCO family protein [Sinorhizobium meliloti]
MNALKFIRYAAWASVAVLAAVLATAAIVPRSTPQAPQPVTTGKALVGGPFQLETVDGKPFSNKDVEDRPYLVFFGFTNCPDVCPTTLFELTGLLKELGPAADKIAPLFISVDPERDTPEMLRVYMNAFDPRITALRGTPDQTQKAAKAFAAYFKKVPLDSGEYTMDHTAGVILIKSDGTFQGTLDMHEPRETQLKKLEMLAASAT